MPYIKINDLEMFYEEFGRGEPCYSSTAISVEGCWLFRLRFSRFQESIVACIRISGVTAEPDATALHGTAV